MITGIVAGRAVEAGPPPGDVFALWSTTMQGSGIALSAGDLAVTSSTDSHVVRGDTVIAEKSYWEVTVANTSGYSPGSTGIVGFYKVSGSPNYEGGVSSVSDHYCGMANRDNFGLPSGGYPDSPAGDTYKHCFDPATGKYWIGSVALGGWFGGGDPDADTSPTFTASVPDNYSAYCEPRQSSQYGTWTANFGQATFLEAPPSSAYPGIR